MPRQTNRVMQANLVSMEQFAFRSQRENETLSRIARQNLKDSMPLKTLTLIATVYLPATFVAVSIKLSPNLLKGNS